MAADPVKILLEIELDDPLSAERTSKALAVDDDPFVKTSINGSRVIGEVSAPTIESARRAADDWLACLMASLKG